MKKRLGFLAFYLFISPFMMHGVKKKSAKSQRSLLIYAQKLNLLGDKSQLKKVLWIHSKFERRLQEEEACMKKNEPEKHERFIRLAYTSFEEIFFLDFTGIMERATKTIEMQEELKKLAGMEENEKSELDLE